MIVVLHFSIRELVFVRLRILFHFLILCFSINIMCVSSILSLWCWLTMHTHSFRTIVQSFNKCYKFPWTPFYLQQYVLTSSSIIPSFNHSLFLLYFIHSTCIYSFGTKFPKTLPSNVYNDNHSSFNVGRLHMSFEIATSKQ